MSLDRIKNYVRSCIKGQRADGLHEGLILSLSEYALDYIGSFLNDKLFRKFLGINYSNRVNQHGVIVHNMNGIMFTSTEEQGIMNPEILTLKDLNYEIGDYSKGKSFTNLKNNPQYREILKKSDAKAFESIDESNAFHFKLMQAIADQL